MSGEKEEGNVVKEGVEADEKKVTLWCQEEPKGMDGGAVGGGVLSPGNRAKTNGTQEMEANGCRYGTQRAIKRTTNSSDVE